MDVTIKLNKIGKQDQCAFNALDDWKWVLVCVGHGRCSCQAKSARTAPQEPPKMIGKLTKSPTIPGSYISFRFNPIFAAEFLVIIDDCIQLDESAIFLPT
jgi:hypothetical protein